MLKDGVGFYNWETWGGGQIPGWPQDVPPRFRWTGMRASVNIKRYLGIEEFRNSAIETEKIKATTFHRALPDEGVEILLMCAHPEIDKDPVRVEIVGDDGIIGEEVFADHRWKRLLLEADELSGSKVLTLQVNRTWNPKLAGISEDSRDLGVAVAVLGR